MVKQYFSKIFKDKIIRNKSRLNNIDELMFCADNFDADIKPSIYHSNVIVHRCVNLISVSASHVPWIVRSNNSKHIHPANLLLKRPNSEYKGADFFNNVISNLLLYGNSYILANSVQNLAPSALYNMHPSSVSPVIRNNNLVAYSYSIRDVNNNQNKIYPIDPVSRMGQILHIKNYSTDNGVIGKSSLKAAEKAIKLYEKTLNWNKSLLSYSTKPSGVLAFQDDGSYLNDEQFARLKEQFYSNFSGSTNSGKPIILEGGLKWQDTNNVEKFEKFLELKDSSARDIAIAFNIPPQLLGINGDNTYSNMQEARLALWEENIIPLLDKLSDALSAWFSYLYAEELVIDFDRDSISALIEKRDNLWENINQAEFMTINEKRAYFGLEPLPDCDKLHSIHNIIGAPQFGLKDRV